jgi:hypothetical protein
LTLASVLVLAGTSMALAQTTPSAPEPKPPAATAPGDRPAVTPADRPAWYSHQPGEMRASKLIGSRVVNAANETIGDINEVVLGQDGKVAAVVIGVGGFLGMGESEVAVSFSSLQMRRDQNGNVVLTLNATKDTLKEAPAWRWETKTR